MPVSQNAWSLHTQDTVVEFALQDRCPVLSGLSASGSRYNWATRSPETVLPERLQTQGHARRVQWEFVEAQAESNRISFAYRCDEFGIDLTSKWTAEDLPGPVEHSVTLTNRGSVKVVFNPVPTIGLDLKFSDGHDLRHWWVEKGAGYMSDEGVHSDPIAPDYLRTLLSGPYSEEGLKREAIPWLCLHDADSAQGVYGGIEFSGWTKTQVRRLCDGKVSIDLGIHDREGMTLHQVRPGETFAFPACFVGAYSGEVDDGCNRLHRWVDKRLMPPAPDCPMPILVNNSWGSGMAVTEELARKMIDDCADLGIELYHVDAGWYKEVGDWHAHPDKLPGGLEAIADYAHSRGLKFGLWIGWTQGGSLRDSGDGALSVFNPKQREWFGADYPPDWKNWDFTGQTVCLGCGDAREWCLKELRRVVSQYKLDLLEHDQPMILDHCIRSNHDHRADDPVDVSRSAAEGYYWVYDELRREFPNLLLENCVNGGRIVDFGVIQRCNYTCATDVYDPLSLRRAFYDTSYPLPPAMIELYIEYLDHEFQDLPEHVALSRFKSLLRSAMLGWCTIMIDTNRWNAEQHEIAKREFDIYKQTLRPLIAHGNVYHVLPRPDGKVWDGIQYHDPDTGHGALIVFRPDNDAPTQNVVLRGLDAAKSYSVSCVDGSVGEGELTGSVLMTSGLLVSLAEPNSSDIILLTAQP
jgi:hypothetical protein